jgi:hypothetical protein
VSETPLSSPLNGPALTEETFDLDEWLSTGTLARRAVPIYNDPALVAEYDVLAQQLTEAQGAVESQDATMGDAGAMAEIYQRMAELHARWQASKATWTVRAVDETELKAITDAHPDPEIPAFMLTPKKPGAVWNEEQLAAGAKYREEREAALTERNIAMIALAVVEVRTPRGVVRSVSVDQIRKLRARPHGKVQTQRLIDAIASATSGEVEVPRPTSPGRSDSDRG